MVNVMIQVIVCLIVIIMQTTTSNIRQCTSANNQQLIYFLVYGERLLYTFKELSYITTCTVYVCVCVCKTAMHYGVPFVSK